MKAVLFIVRKVPNELKIVLAVLATLLLLPLISVGVMATTGIPEVSDALVSVNPTTHQVEVRNADGTIVTTINATTAWPVCGVITTEFGTPHLPFEVRHSGIDIAANGRVIGDPVTPFMEGEVIAVIDSNKGYGKHVIVSHGFGITSLYGHLSALNAATGQRVKPGDVIGLEGSTGMSTGPHVHFETRVAGLPVNPRIFMIGNPVLCRR